MPFTAQLLPNGNKWTCYLFDRGRVVCYRHGWTKTLAIGAVIQARRGDAPSRAALAALCESIGVELRYAGGDYAAPMRGGARRRIVVLGGLGGLVQPFRYTRDILA